MKLRAIRLTNVRRFDDATAEISGIGDGVSVVAAPNEAGKSTMLAALSVALFADHKSKAAEIRDLRPYSGGPVEIAVDLETSDGRALTVAKRFLTRPAAIVRETDTERVIAQDDEAEALISGIAGAHRTGPAGVLWVRQGDSDIEPPAAAAADRSLREDRRAARRDIVSTLVGQVDAMTGGRRMDQVLRACERRLSEILTPTGQIRTGGPLALAIREKDDIEADRDALAEQVDSLKGALQRRGQLRARRADMVADIDMATRAADIARAEAALSEARSQETARSAAEKEVVRAQEDLARWMESSATRVSAAKAVEDTRAAVAEAAAEAETAAGIARGAREEMTKGQARVESARHARERVEAVLVGARARAAAAEVAKRLSVSRAQLDNARTASDRATGLRRLLAEALPTDAALNGAERAQRAVADAEARQAARATALEMVYDAPSGDPIVDEDGTPLPHATAVSLLAPTRYRLPGIGVLAVSPPEPEISEDIKIMRAAREKAFLEVGISGAGGIPALRAQRRKAERDLDAAVAARDAIAPDGMDALERDVDDLAAAVEAKLAQGDGAGGDRQALEDGEFSDLDVSELEARAAAARDEERAADSLLAALRDARDVATETDTRAQVALSQARATARAAQERLDGVLGGEVIAREVAQAETRLAEAKAARAALGEDNVDVGAVKAALEALRQSHADQDKALSDIDREIAECDGIIQARCQDDVEARLAATEEALVAADARRARQQAHADALVLLRDTLDASRRAARDAYLDPVRAELMPLLSRVQDVDEVEIDDTALVPQSVVRNGLAEPVAGLSDGAREQIAVLSRLAFAKLLARTEAHVPVILDDALVYADDARIVRMFEAMADVAEDQQILMLSCRSAAMDALDGARCALTVGARRDLV